MTDVQIQPSESKGESQVGAPIDLESIATGRYFARFGTFFLAADDDEEPIEDIYREVLAALRKDSRVPGIRALRLRPHWSFMEAVYPCGPDIPPEDVLSGNDRAFAVRFSDPLIIELRVPLKNQPVINGDADVPTDHYWVAWDGVTAIVLWEVDEPDRIYAPRSAGHIIHDVLRTAAEDAGYELMQQACSTDCHNMFAHRDIRLVQVPGHGGIVSGLVAGDDVGPANAVIECNGDAPELLRRLWETVEAATGEFALFKNYARRLFAVEDLANEFVTDLLTRDYAAIVHKRLSRIRRVGVRLKALRIRKSKAGRSIDELIAALWLLMASKETLIGLVASKRRSFNIRAAKEDTEVLYVADRREDEHRLEILDLTFVRAAIEQKSSRLDNRIIAVATACGALAAVVGALIGSAWG